MDENITVIFDEMERTEVKDVDKRPEKASPQNYLAVTKRPVTRE